MSKSTSKKSNTTETKALFSDVNITMKTGRLVKDPEIINDGKFIKFRLASNKQYLNGKGEKQAITNYFNYNLEKTFEATKELKKGDWVYVKGEDSTKSFDTLEGYKQTASTIFTYKV